MAISEKAKAYHEKMFPGYVSDFLRTDSEFIERFDNFAFDEVVNQDDLQPLPQRNFLIWKSYSRKISEIHFTPTRWRNGATKSELWQNVSSGANAAQD